MKSAFSANAVLIVSSNGLVLGANAEAGVRWKTTTDALVSKPVASLFDFEVFSSDPDMLLAQWEALRESAQSDFLPVSLLASDASTQTCFVRCEVISGMEDKYLLLLAEPQASAAQPESMAARWDNLVARGPAGFFDLHFDGGKSFLSVVWKKSLGFVDSEIPDTYESWLERLHPEDSDAAPDRHGRRSLAHGQKFQSFSVEYRMRHREGHWVWMQCQGLREFSEEGSLIRVSGFQTDISERKEVEEESVANDERLRALCEAGPLGCFAFDFHGHRAWLSTALRRMLGYSAQDLPDSEDSFLQLIDGADKEAGLGHWFASRGALSSPSWVDWVRFRHRDGRTILLLLGIERELTRRLDLLRVTGFCLSVPQESLESGVRNDGSERFSPMAAYLDEIAEAVLATDAKGLVCHANNAATRLLGKLGAQLLGRPLAEVFPLINRETGKPAPEDPCELALAAEGSLPLSRQHALAASGTEGAATPIVWTAKALFGQGGRANGVVLVFRNPDEMRLTPEELVKANRYEALALLAGGIAHDFNNLLTTILGGISLAKDTKNPQGLEDSEKACMAAKALTKQLLAFAKGGTGTRTVATAPEILKDAVKIAAAGSTQTITVEAPDSLPPVLVDRTQILQVFQNLIVNALQAMPPAPHRGSITIKGEAVNLDADQLPPLPAGQYLRVEVRDNGSGIKPEYLDKIWDPFFTTKKHGTGLGLATVLSMVRKHGGQIGVESELGVGTVFSVFLPAANQPAEVQARRSPSLRYGTGRILFMDDDPKILSLTAGMLENLEYKYDLAHNGEEAVKLYRSYFNIGRPYDVVIMDLTVIGGMGGEDAFRALKEIDPEIRAIAASGYDNDDMARRYLEMGFCGYLTKPYRVGDLGKVIKTVLG